MVESNTFAVDDGHFHYLLKTQIKSQDRTAIPVLLQIPCKMAAQLVPLASIQRLTVIIIITIIVTVNINAEYLFAQALISWPSSCSVQEESGSE